MTSKTQKILFGVLAALMLVAAVLTMASGQALLGAVLLVVAAGFGYLSVKPPRNA